MIRRAKPYVNTSCLKLMYKSLVLPYLDYCSLVWANCNQTLKNEVQRLQNRAAGVITGDSYDTRSKDILSKLGWKNLEERRISQTEAYVTKALQGKCPENINAMFRPWNRENYRLRNNNLVLMLSKPNTNAMKIKGALVTCLVPRRVVIERALCRQFTWRTALRRECAPSSLAHSRRNAVRHVNIIHNARSIIKRLGTRQFSYAAAKIWNSQDTKIRKEILGQ